MLELYYNVSILAELVNFDSINPKLFIEQVTFRTRTGTKMMWQWEKVSFCF